MLELKNITKDYPTGNETVHALKGVSLSFRKNEFVSILGQSGCGKTTLLNIVGGLDRYTDGDLIINGRSTKKYSDRDWDTYRNHSVGFVFQSYNLIPHQTVLENVELALTLSGVSKSERRKRAKEALDAVGLSSQIKKKPSEMSGGQMQRVAIARAIVNDPDIILADEPTGALDSETSVQVMEILKNISKERLVVMVTHNPELAEKYSTRTVRMLDGVIISDSSPVSDDEIKKEAKADLPAETSLNKSKKVKKPSMSFFTSFALSMRNLFTKKGRTSLVSFAGSIGIIGIALIFAVSAGTTSYISYVQESTLSSYPITLEAQHVSIGALMETFIGAAKDKQQHENDAVYQNPVLYDLVNTLSQIEAKENDLRSFKKYLETKLDNKENNKFNAAINGIQYSYGVNLNIYTKNVDGTIIKSDTEELIQKMLVKYMGQISGSELGGDTSMLSMLSGGGMSSMMRVWQELLPAKDGSAINPLIKKQYELLHGEWPNEYNEIVIVVDENNEIDDMTLYALGLISDEEIDKIVTAAANDQPLEFETQRWSYDEICNMEFRTILNADLYSIRDGVYKDISAESMALDMLYSNGISLKVTGIIKLQEGTASTLVSGTIGYTHHLTEYVAEQNKKSEAILFQKSNPTLDIFTGLPFADADGVTDNATKAQTFRNHVANMTVDEKSEIYLSIISIPSPEYLSQKIGLVLANMTPEIMRDALVSQIMSSQSGMPEDKIRDYVNDMSDEDITKLISGFLAEQETARYAAEQKALHAGKTPAELAAMFDEAIIGYTDEQCAAYYDSVFEFSNSTYELNMQKLGYVDLDQPTAINLFATSFADKDVIEEMISSYNKGVDEISRIEYTDYMGIMMSSITTIIDAITYVLAAFVSVSLVVSSIMIGVITLISVQERTKEIGILRAIGASKRNVCSMFNAETVIIGFASGTIGVLITYLLCIPINLILNTLTGIPNLKAVLDIEVALFLITVSVVLNLISGFIPSRSAAKKDPVVALRTE